MITLDNAIEQVNKYLDGIQVIPPIELVLLYDETVEFKYGWAFFFQSKEYVETGDFMSAIAGNGLIIFNKYDGSILQTGTAHSAEHYISEYVRDLDAKEGQDPL